MPEDINQPGASSPESAAEESAAGAASATSAAEYKAAEDSSAEKDSAAQNAQDAQGGQENSAKTAQPALEIPGVTPSDPVVDIAYAILKNDGESLDYRELLDRIVEFKHIVSEDLAKVMSRLYTEINLDPRFVYIGSGAWGLKEWLPKAQVTRSVGAQTIPQRSRTPDRWHEEGALEETDVTRRPDEEEEDWSPEPD